MQSATPSFFLPATNRNIKHIMYANTALAASYCTVVPAPHDSVVTSWVLCVLQLVINLWMHVFNTILASLSIHEWIVATSTVLSCCTMYDAAMTHCISL